MKCLLITHNPPLLELVNWLSKQDGSWTVEVHPIYVQMATVIDTLRGAFEEMDTRLDISAYDRVLFIPPPVSPAVLPFFDELLQFCREDVVPEQLNMIRGPGGDYIPCPEYPIYQPVVA